jgi:hypothetical protein
MKEEKIKPKFLEKWEKESYEKGWKDGRKELIGEIEKRVLVSPKVKIEYDDTLGYFKVKKWKNLKKEGSIK